MARKKIKFEEALKQLEGIAEQIEQGKIGLEQSIDKYEQGMALVQQCREILTRAEHRIQQLQQRADGTLDAKPWRKMETEITTTERSEEAGTSTES